MIMTEQILNELKRFKENGIYPFHDDLLPEMRRMLIELKSLNIVGNKNGLPTLEIIDLILLEKLIELKSMSDFKIWLDKKDKNITNNFSNSTIGQVNQSGLIKIDKTEIKQTNYPKISDGEQNIIISLLKKFWLELLISLISGIILSLI